MLKDNSLCIRNGGDFRCGERMEHTPPGAQKLCVEALRGRIGIAKNTATKSVSRRGPGNDIHVASAHIDLALAGVFDDEATYNFNEARRLLTPAISRGDASRVIIQRARWFHIFLDAFPYARKAEQLPEELRAQTMHNVQRMFLDTEVAPVHLLPAGHHRQEEGHIPCFSSEEGRRREDIKLALFQLCTGAGLDIYPTTIRESEAPSEFADFRSDAFVVYEGKKTNLRFLGKQSLERARKGQPKGAPLNFTLGNFLSNAICSTPGSVGRFKQRNNGLVTGGIQLLRKEAKGAALRNKEAEILQSMRDEIKSVIENSEV